MIEKKGHLIPTSYLSTTSKIYKFSLVENFRKFANFSLRLGKKVFQRSPEAVVQRCSVKKVFLELSQNSQENSFARAPFLIKLQAETSNFIKKRLWDRCFPVNLVKLLKTPFLREHLRWLPLVVFMQAVLWRCSQKQASWKRRMISIESTFGEKSGNIKEFSEHIWTYLRSSSFAKIVNSV